MALLGAELLAPFLEQALARGGADTAVRRAYESAWHRRFDRRVRLCRLFHHLLVNPSWVDLAAAFPSPRPASAHRGLCPDARSGGHHAR
jgi:hypothetical protein